MYQTYSFQDVNVAINHPAVGRYAFNGEGVGSVGIAMANDTTAHDVAADGNVMVTKIITKNGTITIQAQQTSDLHRWLEKWNKYITAAPTSQWAKGTFFLECPATGKQYTCKGVSPQKPGDDSYQQQGQNVTWTLMAAEIEREVI